jgi:hypothetical protein
MRSFCRALLGILHATAFPSVTMAYHGACHTGSVTTVQKETTTHQPVHVNRLPVCKLRTHAHDMHRRTHTQFNQSNRQTDKQTDRRTETHGRTQRWSRRTDLAVWSSVAE